MASRRSIERRKRIIAIRDKALALIERQGEPFTIKNAPWESLAVTLGPCLVSLITIPGFLKLKPELEASLLDGGICFDSDLRWLSLWAPHKGRTEAKVMFPRWTGTASETFDVVRFRRGDWEEQFLGLDMTSLERG